MMEEFTMGNGQTIKCKELEHTLGQMVVDMKASISKIKSMAMVSTIGLMEESIKAIGMQVSNMGRELI